MTLSQDLLRGYTDTIILRRLAEGDSYGYAISKRVSEISGGACALKEATLYTAFRRLEQAGLISSYWGDENSGARRRYYALTEMGQLRLEEDCLAWETNKALIEALIGEEHHE